MRWAARTDGNQSDLIKELRKIGADVADTSRLGGGFPDLVVGYRGTNYLIEVKDPKQKPSDRKLTPKEKDFFDRWGSGPCFVVETLDGFLELAKHHEKRVV